MPEDRRLQRPRWRWFDAQPVNERGAGRAVFHEGIRLAPRTVEGDHQLAAKAFTQRMLLHQCLELAREHRVVATGQIGIHSLAEAGEAQIFEPSDVGLGEALVADVDQRRAAPQRKDPFRLSPACACSPCESWS